MSPMTTMTTTTATTSSSSGGSTTTTTSSNNRLKQQQQQHNVEANANLIKEGKVKLTNAILTKNRNEMKEALIILSKTKLTTTTHKTSIRSKCNPQIDDDDDDDDDDVNDVEESSDDDRDDDDGSDYDEDEDDSNNTVYYYTEYQFCQINLSYDSSLLSECIFGGGSGGGGGRNSDSTGNNTDENDNENENENDISTEMVRLLLMPFKVVEQMITTNTNTTTTTLISTNAGSFINGLGGGGGTLLPPLIRACHYQNYNLVRLLLDFEITDPNICATDGLTPLIRMSKIGDLQMIKLLLLERNDVNIYQYDQQSMNALIHACTENHIDIVRYLLDYSSKKSNSNSNSNSNLNLDYVNDYKVDPPIWYACAHGNAAIVRLLLDEYGATIRYRKDPTIYSSTPFMEACEWGHLEVVKIVLERDPTNNNHHHNHHHGTSSSSSSLSLLIEDDDETRTTTILKARELARSAGYNKVVELIDFWSLRIQNIETTFIHNNINCSSLGNDEVDDNDNDDGNEDDDCVNENKNKNENEVNNNNNDNKKKKKNQKKIDLIPHLLPIGLSMTAKRYDLTYRIISRHTDIICSYQ